MKILIVDDESFRVVLLLMLEDLFPESCIDVASGLVEAQEYLRSYPYDFVLSDLNLGKGAERDGIEILHEAKKNNINVVAILMSAEKMKEEEIAAAGIDQSLEKPIEMELIEKIIQNFWKRS